MQEDRKSSDVVWQQGLIPQSERWSFIGHRGATLWFTGLSGSGKSTIALACEKLLVSDSKPACLLDGDNLRHGLNRDLGFSLEERNENVRRVAEVSKLFAEAGVVALVPLVSPYREARHHARLLHEKNGIPFFEIFVNTPIELCETRDPKGLYKKARAGEIKGFTGIDDPYEEPEKPDLVIKPIDGMPEAAAVLCLKLLE